MLSYFVLDNMQTYDGMIIGEHSRDTDLDVRSCYFISYCVFCHVHLWLLGDCMKQVNPVKSKELNNIRAASKDENVKLTPPRLVSFYFACTLSTYKTLCCYYYLSRRKKNFCCWHLAYDTLKSYFLMWNVRRSEKFRTSLDCSSSKMS